MGDGWTDGVKYLPTDISVLIDGPLPDAMKHTVEAAQSAGKLALAFSPTWAGLGQRLSRMQLVGSGAPHTRGRSPRPVRLLIHMPHASTKQVTGDLQR